MMPDVPLLLPDLRPARRFGGPAAFDQLEDLGKMGVDVVAIPAAVDFIQLAWGEFFNLLHGPPDLLEGRLELLLLVVLGENFGQGIVRLAVR